MTSRTFGLTFFCITVMMVGVLTAPISGVSFAQQKEGTPNAAPDKEGGDSRAGEEELRALYHNCTGGFESAQPRVEACSELLENPDATDEERALLLAFRASARLEIYDYSSALQDFSEALEIEPDNATYLNGRARALGLLGETQLAIQDLDHAIEVAPSFGWLFVSRAIAFTEVGNDEAALRDLAQAEELDPTDPDLYNVRGGVYLNLEDYDSAVADFSHAIDLAPGHEPFYERRGFAYLLADDPSAAVDDFTYAIDSDPSSPSAFYYRAIGFEELEDMERALADYSAAVDLDPTLARAWHSRGLIWNELEDYSRAREDLELAAQISPNSNYLNAIAWLLVSAGDQEHRDPQVALGYVDQSMELDLNADNVDTAGGVHTLLGNIDRAMEYYVQSMDLGGEDRVLLYQEFLAERDYYTGEVDGIDGPATRDAIRAFAEDGKVMLAD